MTETMQTETSTDDVQETEMTTQTNIETPTETETPEPHAEDAAAPQDAGADVPVEDPQTERNGNKEAAKYRVQLREAEAERDALRTQLEAVQWQMLDSARGRGSSVTPALMQKLGHTPGEFLNDDGTVDTLKYRSTVDKIAVEYGLALPTGSYVPLEGSRSTPGDYTNSARENFSRALSYGADMDY